MKKLAILLAALLLVSGVAYGQGSQIEGADISGGVGTGVISGIMNEDGTARCATEDQACIPSVDSVGGTVISTTSGAGAAVHAEDSAHTSGDSGNMCLGVVNEGKGALAANGDYTALGLTDAGGLMVAIDRQMQILDAHGLLKAEDSAHASGDAGVFAVGVANNPASLTTFSGAFGDYTPLAVDANGSLLPQIDRRMQLSDANSILKAEDSVAADGDAIVAVGGMANESQATLAAANDYIPLAVDIRGQVALTNRFGAGAYLQNGATTMGKLEDSAHVSGDALVGIAAVRNDALGNLCGTDGDYCPIATNGAGALAIQGRQLEDAAAANADYLLGIATKRTDSPATSAGTDGDYATLNTDAAGKVWVTGTYVEDLASTAGDNMMVIGGIAKVANGPEGTAGTAGDYEIVNIDLAHGAMFTNNVDMKKSVDVALTVDTAAYAAGDYINDADDITDLASAFRTAVNSGKISSVVVTDEGAEGKNLEVWFFDTDPTSSTFTDNAAFAVADADLVNVCCVVSVNSHYAANDNGVSRGVPDDACHCVSAGTTLYAAIVAREAVTFDATDAVTLRVVIDQD